MFIAAGLVHDDAAGAARIARFRHRDVDVGLRDARQPGRDQCRHAIKHCLRADLQNRGPPGRLRRGAIHDLQGLPPPRGPSPGSKLSPYLRASEAQRIDLPATQDPRLPTGYRLDPAPPKVAFGR
jgi:hypothetical protein